jgi:signal transduction histidine kinase
MLRRLIGEGIELSTQLAEGLDLVEAPPGQIEQVIVNLVINARDAMPSGGTLRIKTARLDEPVGSARVLPCRSVMLSISDTGVGMSAEIRLRLFDPFFTTKPPGSGTGLGLSIVQELVAAQQGTVRVESELGRGTTVAVSLQAVPA